MRREEDGRRRGEEGEEGEWDEEGKSGEEEGTWKSRKAVVTRNADETERKEDGKKEKKERGKKTSVRS